MIHTTDDFYNKVVTELTAQYFPGSEGDRYSNKEYLAMKYAIELFNNGCLTYRQLVGRTAKHCKSYTKEIHATIEKYVVSFGKYQYKPSNKTTK